MYQNLMLNKCACNQKKKENLVAELCPRLNRFFFSANDANSRDPWPEFYFFSHSHCAAFTMLLHLEHTHTDRILCV